MTYGKAGLQIAGIIIILTLATVGLHEAGHYIAGTMSGCGDLKISLFDLSGNAHTEMVCPAGTNLKLIFAAGLLIVLPFSYLIWKIRRIEYYSAVVLGFNILISLSDISSISGNLLIPAVFVGAVAVLYGQNIVIDKKMKLIDIDMMMHDLEIRAKKI